MPFLDAEILFQSWPGLCKALVIYGKSESDIGHGCRCEVSEARQVNAAWIFGNWIGSTGDGGDSAGDGWGSERE
jgi:hypothetical protein